MATPHCPAATTAPSTKPRPIIPHHQHQHSYFIVLLITIMISFQAMEPVEAFNDSDKLISCKELSCENHNACYTTTANGTQDGHAYCKCQGEWAGLRCQSKLYITRLSSSATSVALRMRAMTSSSKIPQKVPMAKLYVTDFSVSFWNLNGSAIGCSILRMKTLTSRITIKGLDKGQEYMICVANGGMDLCRLQSSNHSIISKKSNCIKVITLSSDTEPFNIIGFVLVPIVIVIFIAIIIAILVVRRKSMFVQFLLYFCCCRKCHCCRTRSLRKKHLVRKQRNTSGNFLLPPDPDQPLDDSMSFGARSFPSNSVLSGAGNRSSVISDSFRSGFTPDSDDRCPSFLEETPNPLFNPNVLSNLEYQPFGDAKDFHCAPPESVISYNYSDVSSLPLRQNSSPSTFQTSSVVDYRNLPYFIRQDNLEETSRNIPSSSNRSSCDVLNNPTTDSNGSTIHTGAHNSSNPPQFSSASEQSGAVFANHFPPHQEIQTDALSQTSSHQSSFNPTNPPATANPNNQQTHSQNSQQTLTHSQNNQHTLTHSQTNQPTNLPNGKPRLFRRHYSTPVGQEEQIYQPESMRVFPHGDEWTRHIRNTYNYYNTPTHVQSTFTNDPNSSDVTFRNSLRRKRRPIMKRRPLSYDLDYHRRYHLDYDFLHPSVDVMTNGVDNHPPASSQDVYAVATLPRRIKGQPPITTTQNSTYSQYQPRTLHHFARSNSTSDSFHYLNAFYPHESNNMNNGLQQHSAQNSRNKSLSQDRIPNGDLFSNSKDDTQSMSSSYTESSVSKDSNNSNEAPLRKKRVKSIIGQFDRALPPFLRQSSRRNSTTFSDEEYFRDLASPLHLERSRRKSSNAKKKGRPLSQPVMFEFNGNMSSHEEANNVDLDPIFQGHPSKHVLPPLTVEDDEYNDGSNLTDKERDLLDKGGGTSDVMESSYDKSSRKVIDDTYVISAFDDDSTNLVTPFIVKKTSSDESLDRSSKSMLPVERNTTHYDRGIYCENA